MKWFKHFTDASDDEFIAELENRFGLEGYARWWKLLEVVGGQFKKEGLPIATYPWSVWQAKLKGKRKKLEPFLGYLYSRGKINLAETEHKEKTNPEQTQNKPRTNPEQTGNEFCFSQNVLEISIPKLLEIRDEYSKKSGQTPDTLRSPLPLPLPLQKEGFNGSKGGNNSSSGNNPKGVKKGGEDERFN